MGKNLKNIVVSAVNFSEGGPLEILKGCLKCLSEEFPEKYAITAIVHSKSLFDVANVEYYELPDSKKSWFRRLYYEYVYFRKLSKTIKPYLWLSLHDITPNVEAEVRAVYCHNSCLFYKLSFKEIMMAPRFALFNLLYEYLYMVNMKKNDLVIVQQDWMRKKFAEIYNVKNILVAHPFVKFDSAGVEAIEKTRSDENFMFFYPSFPRIFKNFEIICEATKILVEKGVDGFEVCLTIDGKENRYARYLYNRYKSVDRIRFAGLVAKQNMHDCYNRADCLVFPSKLESWGLPLSEFKNYGKPILTADLEYARETMGAYGKVKFFAADDPFELAELMEKVMDGNLTFDRTEQKNIEKPFATNWKEIFDLLLKEKNA